MPTLSMSPRATLTTILTPIRTMKTLSQIKEVIAANREAGNFIYENLESSEIGQYSGWLMFGDDEEAFPSQAEWAMITD